MKVLSARNPGVEMRYVGTAPASGLLDPGTMDGLFDDHDHVVTQPDMNLNNRYFHGKISKRLAGKITLMPDIRIDGLHSLCFVPYIPGPIRKKFWAGGFLGGAVILDALAEVGLEETLRRYRAGELDFRHRERLDLTLAEMARRDTLCHVKYVNRIEELYRERQILITSSHPTPEPISELAGLLAKRLDLAFQPVTTAHPWLRWTITLPREESVVSPWTVRDLGLAYDYDLFWVDAGQRIIRRIAEQLQPQA